MYLKCENVNIKNEGSAGEKFWVFKFLHLKMKKWTKNKLTCPYKIYLPQPLRSKTFWPSSKTENSKIRNPPY